MTEMESDGAVKLLKVDTKGRVRVSRQRREALLEEYERGGMSAAAFAQWAGIKYPTFAWWLQERRRAQEKVDRGDKAEAMAWVEAVVDEGGGGAGSVLVIELPGGARMEVGDRLQAGLAAEVLRVLGRVRGC